MHRRARVLPLLLVMLALASCSATSKATQAPPLVFPTAPQATPGPAPLSIYLTYGGLGAPPNNRILAIDAHTGKLRWQYPHAGQLSRPVVANNLVYVGASNQQIYAFHANTGSIAWTYKIAATLPTILAVQHGTVYAGGTFLSPTQSQPDVVYALNASDGKLKWRSQVAGMLVAVSQDTVYVSARDQKLYALNAADGSERWHFQANAQVFTAEEMNGLVYVPAITNAFSGAFYALAHADGSLQWRYPGGAGTKNALTWLDLDRQTIYLAGSSDSTNHGANQVIALNASDGTQRWTYQIPQGTVLSARQSDGTLYVGSTNGKVYALDGKDGAVRWQVQAGVTQTAVQWLSNGVIYAYAPGAGLIAISESTGTISWHHAVENNLLIINVTEGLIYIATGPYTGSGTLSAISATDGSTFWSYPLAGGFAQAMLG